MGWMIFGAVVIALAILPLGLSARYDEGGAVVRVIAGPVKIQVFPMKKKPKREKTEKPREGGAGASKEVSKEAKSPTKSPKGGAWLDFLPLARVALDLLNDLRRKLRVDHLKLHLTMAADDPCDLAVNYGRMNASVSALLAQLDRFLVIKKRDVHIDCDFTASETVVLARLDLTITLGRLLSIAARYGIRAFKAFLNIKKQQEGGADL